jgi:hypothetical protein
MISNLTSRFFRSQLVRADASIANRCIRCCFTILFFVTASGSFAIASTADKTGTADKHRISGTVTLPDGKPANEATVYLLPSVKGARTLPTHPLRAETDANGKYVFDDVDKGSYRLWSETNELTSLEEKLQGMKIELAQAQEADMSFDLSLHEGCRYAVTVLDKANRQPVSGAEISFGWTDIDRGYTTSQQGFIEIAGLAIDEWYFVVKAKNYSVSYRKLPKQPLGSRTELVFELEPGSTLTGTIHDETGNAVHGAKVGASEVVPSMTPGLGRTETDRDGKYQLTSLPRGTEIRLSVTSANHVAISKNLTIPLDRSTINTDMSLVRRVYGGDCIVHVDDEKGSPIAGATIENMGNSSRDVRRGKTDDHGIARIDDLFSNYQGMSATVKAAGYIAQQIPLVAGSKDKPGEVKVTLIKGESIRGRLLKPDGDPAAAVWVFFNDGESGGGQLGGRVDTDQEGRFQIDGLPSPSTFTFYTPKPFAPISRRSLPVGGREEVVVTMEFEGVIRIRARDETTQKPIPEFNVKIGFSPDSRPTDPRINGLSSNLINPGTDILGNVKEFRLGQLPPGAPLQITVSANGYSKFVLRRVEATVESESEAMEVELIPEDESMFRTVTGLLVDSVGKPVAGASLRLLVCEDSREQVKWRLRNWNSIESGQVRNDADCLQFLMTTSKQDGSFKFERVKNGLWMEVIYTGGHTANGRQVLEDPQEDQNLKGLEIEAPFAGSVRVSVDVEKHPKAYSVQIMAQDAFASFGYTEKKLGDDGKDVLFDQLPPGKYNVSIQEKPVAKGNNMFEVKSLKSETVDIFEKEEAGVEFR